MKLEDAQYDMPDSAQEAELRAALMRGRRERVAATLTANLAQDKGVIKAPETPDIPDAPEIALAEEEGKVEPTLSAESPFEVPPLQTADDALLLAAPTPFFLPDDTPRISGWWNAAVVILALLLAGQWIWHDKADLARQIPAFGEWLANLEVKLPLPTDADKISIVSSNLEAGSQPGALSLSATLENYAGYPQAWPAIELTLTDTFDTVLARKVLLPADYLPSRTDAVPSGEAFAPGTLSLRLPLSVGNLNPAGYRLYLFYAS
ncbi:MAG: DUF3426 domain-containing protein [Zoogloeaceae bacterium]|jgi:hypothetical protein|nr:DUF3426 domain-containing protein [Zoogloeaceae bacterium]